MAYSAINTFLLSFNDTDDSDDDELLELFERKKRLEKEKETLNDVKLRRRAEREKLKAKLQTDVKTLEHEVAELSIRYKGKILLFIV